MFKQKDTIKFKEITRFKVEGQQYSSMKGVYGKVLITFYMVREDGTFVTTSRFPKPDFFPKFLQGTIVKLFTPKTLRLKKKVLKLDKELGKKKQG